MTSLTRLPTDRVRITAVERSAAREFLCSMPRSPSDAKLSFYPNSIVADHRVQQLLSPPPNGSCDPEVVASA
jgi:hypothetical protein